MVAAGTVTPSRLVTHRFDLDDALDAYDLMLGKTKDPYLGIVIDYPGEQDGAIGAADRRVDLAGAGEVKEIGAQGRVGVGFIGAGNFTKSVLLPVLKKQTDVDLKGVCTATGMNAAETGRKEKFAYAVTDFRQVLDDPETHAVFVTTRHNSHARFVTAALAAGKHVFVEKPLCISQEELDQVYSFRESVSGENKTDTRKTDLKLKTSNLKPVLMVGFNRRFSPHARLIRDYFNGRKTPMMVNYRINAGIIAPDVWIQDPETGGGRIIGEVCHFIDFASFVIGSYPVEVQAMCVDSGSAALVAEDNVSISIRYQDGSVAQILYVATGAADLAKERCEVFADESTAVMDNFTTTVCMGRRGKKKLKGRQNKGFTEEITAFLDAVKTGGPPPIPFTSLALTTACTFAVRQSLRTGGGVRPALL
jgi:predicted dehydrogenase